MLDSFRTNDGDDVLTYIQEDLSLRCAIRTFYAVQQCSDLYEQRGRHLMKTDQTGECSTTVVSSICTAVQLANGL